MSAKFPRGGAGSFLARSLKGIACCPALKGQTCEHILEFMGEQGVTDVRRTSVFHDGVKNKQTHLYSLSIHQLYLQWSK